MNQISRVELVRELAKLATLVEHDAVSGVVLVAVHEANESATVIVAPPSSKIGVDKLMGALDRTVFRAKIAMYLAPEKGRAPLVAVPDKERPQ
jgi:hypothetical protein